MKHFAPVKAPQSQYALIRMYLIIVCAEIILTIF